MPPSALEAPTEQLLRLTLEAAQTHAVAATALAGEVAALRREVEAVRRDGQVAAKQADALLTDVGRRLDAVEAVLSDLKDWLDAQHKAALAHTKPAPPPPRRNVRGAAMAAVRVVKAFLEIGAVRTIIVPALTVILIAVASKYLGVQITLPGLTAVGPPAASSEE